MDGGTLALLALLAVDANQTYQISDHCHKPVHQYREGNPLLGKCPTRSEVRNYFMWIAMGVSVIDSGLPKYAYGLPVKTIWRVSFTAVQGYAIGGNMSMGFNVRF